MLHLLDSIRPHLTGVFAEAENIYRQVLKDDPTNIEAWNKLGLIATSVRNHAVAVKFFTKSLELDPSNSNNITRFDLALSLKALGKRAEALALFQDAWMREFDNTFLSMGDFGTRKLTHWICCESTVDWAYRFDHLRAYAELIAEKGAFHGLEPLLDEVRSLVSLADTPPSEMKNRILLLVYALGFNYTSDTRWNAKVFNKLVLPWMKELLSLGKYNLALILESEIIKNYVRQIETSAHFGDCFSQWVPAMREAGIRVGENIAPLTRVGTTELPVVGFFIHTASLLAHVEALLGMLEGWAAQDTRLFNPRVYVFSGDDSTMVERFTKLGVAVINLDRTCSKAHGKIFSKLLCLREQCNTDRVTALVWVSSACFMALSFAMRVAPVQIWWAMKHHNLEFDEIDGYLALGAFENFKELYGRKWRICHSTLIEPPFANVSTEVARLLNIYGRFEIILGSLGREEKLNSPAFLEAIARILHANPRAVYLWTGKTELKSITRFFDQHGIAERCFFIGWVDVAVYAQVLDVFLDSFPFPCTTTGLYSMLAGKPMLMYRSVESLATGVAKRIVPVLEGTAGTSDQRNDIRAIFTAKNGNNLFLIADTPDQYVALADRLIRDAEFRRAVGEAGKTFVMRYLLDKRLAATSFSEHLLEIIAEKIAHKGAI